MQLCNSIFLQKNCPMRKQSLVVLLLLLSWQACSLSLPHSIHLQTVDQQKAYLTQLINMENNLKQQLDAFQILVNSINNNVTAYEGLTTIQTQALETGISAERDSLSTITEGLALPLDKKTWDCKMFTQAQLDSINQKISETQRNIATLQQKIDAEPDCQRNIEILTQIQFLNAYLNNLVKQVGSNCGSVIVPAKNVYVPNSKNQYYVYGTQGEQTYNNNVQNLLNQQYTKIECPPELPYPNGNTCVGCPQDKTHYYDLTQNVCLSCPDGYTFQITTHVCTRKSYNSNNQAPNFIGTIPAPTAGLETCPIETPFFDGSICRGCPTSSFFDFGTLTCQTCPDNTVFDPMTRLCTYKKFNTYIDPNTKNYCCGTLANDPNVQTCPKETPFFNGKQCVGCSLPAYFSIQTLTCTLCPDGQGFSLIQGKCIASKYLQTVYTSLVSTQVQNYLGTPPTVDPAFEKVAPCPIDRPYYNGNSCIQCTLPNYFSFEVNQCLVCPAEFSFDLGTHKCVRIQSTRFNSNMISLNNFVGTIPDYNSQLATCPADQPFFNGNSCIPCSLPNYADFGTLSCQACSSGFSFNTENRQCVISKPQFYTNTKASNIYYNGNFNTVLANIQTLKLSNPGIQECTTTNPYFNYQKNACISCETEYPLFDLKYNRCISCSNKSTYNAESRLCLQDSYVPATVERMIMNTVGWG